MNNQGQEERRVSRGGQMMAVVEERDEIEDGLGTRRVGEAAKPGPGRPRDGRDKGELRVVTANITTWSKHGVDAYGLGADVVALQEHCIRRGSERAARAEAMRGGCRLWLGEAPDRGAPNTTHAGTGVLTRLDLPALPLGKGEGDLKGRWSSVRIGGG